VNIQKGAALEKEPKNNYTFQAEDIIESARILLSDIRPSAWNEKFRVMTSEVSPFPGKFSYNRTPYLREVVDCLSPDHPAKFVAVMKGAQIGFALKLNTPIMTSEGWATMGNLKKGDKVFDETGQLCNIIATSKILHNRKCYKVFFTDDSFIECDADHLWTVYDLKNIRRTLTTEQINKRVKNIRKNGKERSTYYIYNTKPVFFLYKELPVDPYLLGLWLGDGGTNSNKITATKSDAFEYRDILKNKGIEVVLTPYKNQSGTYHVKIQNAFNTWKGGFNYYGKKRIPEIYKTASIAQRLELLQGLIDTDGHIRKNGMCEFYNINLDLINDVRELIASLGLKSTIRKRDNSKKFTTIVPGREYKMKDIYVVNFFAYQELPVSKLIRKKSRLRKRETIRVEIHKKWICKIEECETAPVKCISVDSKSKLYLAGKTFTPTHNSTGVIEAGIGWIISENPGNTLFLTGHAELAEEAMNSKIDQMIDSTGLRPMIRPNVMRAKNMRTGDTQKSKEFPGGSLTAGHAGNHKLLRQRSVRYGFIDDFDAAKSSSKESGSTTRMIQQRFAAYSDKMKLYYISTPELKQISNIEPVFLKGDQRYYFIPCPCCGDFINLKWVANIEGNEKEKAGITWKADERGRLIAGTVGYICQSCAGFFTDHNKYDLNLMGRWQPTAAAIEEGFYSYHINSLYAPPGMYDWAYYVKQYIEACPEGEKRKEDLYKTFVNLCLGETYEETGEAPKANELQKNVRDYSIQTIPEKLSIADGNGEIVLLTCACDLNGKVDDARIDYEVVAWAESGSSYSVMHGSIGTFVPREGEKKKKEDRERLTYEFNKRNPEGKNISVWPLLSEVIDKIYETDTNRKMKIMISGVDCGFHSIYAYAYIDGSPGQRMIVGLKGKDEEKFIRFGVDLPYFKPAKERANLYLVEVNNVKDDLADYIKLQWDEGNDERQPPGFMNFPIPSGGLYLFKNFFSHYEAEHRIVENKEGQGIAAKWVKKNTNVQNHFFDVRVYNLALKDILINKLGKEVKEKNFTWGDYVAAIMGRKKN
jgi:phage terminase large subunit GpA-like protein